MKSGVRGNEHRTSALLAALTTIFACHHEGFLHVRGQVLAAADKTPIQGASVGLAFGSSEPLKDDCGTLAATEYTSDAEGNFDTGARMYPIGCDGCKYGVVCVARAGFQTWRVEFSDCESDWGGGGVKDLVVELQPE